jgi:hypothetical protein
MPSTKVVSYIAAGFALLATHGVPSAAFGQTGQATQQSAPGTVVARTSETRATVESVDQNSREIVLRGAGGARLSVKAGPEVRNLAQIHAGDQVVIRYTEALAARLASPGESGGAGVQVQGGVARTAPPGASPAGVAAEQVRTVIQVDAIDRANNTLTFTGPGGAARTVTVRDPDAQRFLQTLKPGDRVDVLYTESLAVAVEPMQR